MELDIILNEFVSPQETGELAQLAESYGFRGLWSASYGSKRDPFMSLNKAAELTSRIRMGPLAVSPMETHPLKMANQLLTLNEWCGGRAMIAVGGGGGVLGALGWKASADSEPWPGRHPVKGTRYPDRRVRGVQECLDVLKLGRTGKLAMGFPGEIFDGCMMRRKNHGQASRCRSVASAW